MSTYLGLVAGVVLLAAAVYFRLGRGPGARWWVANESVGVWGTQAGVVMGVLPGFGLLVLALSLGGLEARWSTVTGGLLIVLAIPVMIVGTIFPRLLGPRWWRRELKAASSRGRGRKR